MSDVAPPTYKKDLAELTAMRSEVYASLKLTETNRNQAIFERCCEIIAFSYENNRIPGARIKILTKWMKDKIEDLDMCAHILD